MTETSQNSFHCYYASQEQDPNQTLSMLCNFTCTKKAENIEDVVRIMKTENEIKEQKLLHKTKLHMLI